MDIKKIHSEGELAKVAYNSYVASVGGTSPITGDPLPPFEGLSLQVTAGWIAAARAVATAVRSERNE